MMFVEMGIQNDSANVTYSSLVYPHNSEDGYPMDVLLLCCAGDDTRGNSCYLGEKEERTIEMNGAAQILEESKRKRMGWRSQWRFRSVQHADERDKTQTIQCRTKTSVTYPKSTNF
ncbi:unnamed protein product [Urochloa humidicola]